MASASNAQLTQPEAEVDLLDLAPDTDRLLTDVLAGLGRTHKTLPSKYFYDSRGAQIFEKICDLDEYYPTRTELAILQDNLPTIAARIGPSCNVIEPGSGSGIKTRLLLDALAQPAAYIPIDVAREQLIAYANELAVDFPDLSVLPVCADFTQPIQLPTSLKAGSNKLIYFPGSTIGNFAPAEATALMRRWHQGLGERGALLIGVDLKKDPLMLEAAYNDSEGITAAFNLNLLRRINRELNANFELDQFEHYASYDRLTGAVRMWLISQCRQQVRINDTTCIDFDIDEAICTEHSYKYAVDEFASLAEKAGWSPVDCWTDAGQKFSLHYLEATAD